MKVHVANIPQSKMASETLPQALKLPMGGEISFHQLCTAGVHIDKAQETKLQRYKS